MGFADLFRPKWKHSKATVRAQALRGLATNKHDVLVEVARHDADDSVRRVAVSLLRDPDVLSSIADGDNSEVGTLAAKRATALWAHAAMSAKDANAAKRALHHIDDGKTLANIVDGARKQSVRQAALVRLTDPKVSSDKVLAELARAATDPAIRRQMIEAISDASILRGIAVAGTPRDAAITAIETLSDVEALQAITKKATRKSLRNRAKRRLAQLVPTVPQSEPSGPTQAQHHYATQLRLLAVVESAMVGKAYDLSAEVADATQSWESLEAT
ncbi:MAG: hypothetical protein JKY87_05875, partial [Mariprofundus sp.]|nr:hypothetical protein [Mariprofundus sp.]